MSKTRKIHPGKKQKPKNSKKGQKKGRGVSATRQQSNTRPARKVSLDEWRALYQAAIDFREAAPWTWIGEMEICGIRHPQSKEAGYLSIMGRRGEHRALSIYQGEVGFAKFLDFSMQDFPDESSDIFQLFEIPHIEASFGDRDQLSSEDRAVIKALGLSFHGRGQWPLFRVRKPGYAAWYLDPVEVQWLTWGLEQALAVSLRVKAEGLDLLTPFLDKETLLYREAQQIEGQWVWKDAWDTCKPSLPEQAVSLPEELFDVLEQGVQQRDLTVELDFFALPIIFSEQHPPLQPYYWMAVDSRSGMVLAFETVTVKGAASWEETLEHLPARIFARLGKALQGIPAGLEVSSARLGRLLHPVCNLFKIELELYEELSALEEAKEFFLARL